VRRIFLIPLLVCTVIAIYGAVLLHAIARQAEVDEARPADAIVVFGAAEYHGRPSHVLRARLEHALDLYRRHCAPRIILTGGAGGEWPYTEATVGKTFLESQGVAASAMSVEPRGISTADSVERVTELMRSLGLHNAIVVSDGYHIFRIKKLFAKYGFAVYGSPRPQDPTGSAVEREWMMLRQAVSYTLWKLGLSQ
jgi:uncharacterized SAM-binding protein YcdF (DUF218 family)